MRRKFVDARVNNPAKASEALAYIRTLYAVEKEIADGKLASDAVVSLRHARAGPILRRFGEWLEVEQRTALPKSPFGAALSYALNQMVASYRLPCHARRSAYHGKPFPAVGHDRVSSRPIDSIRRHFRNPSRKRPSADTMSATAASDGTGSRKYDSPLCSSLRTRPVAEPGDPAPAVIRCWTAVPA